MVVLITGCRSGFGLLSAVEAARRGHVVYAGLRAAATADRLREAAQGLDVRPLQLDVLSPDQRDGAVARILSEEGRLDGLVNNAGIAMGGFLEQLEEDEIRRLFDVNVLALWAMTKAALPALRASRGCLINVSSISGRIAMPSLGAYGASKHAVEGMTEAWRHELAPFGVRVALIEPGPYKTDIFERNRLVGRRVREPASPYAPLVAAVEAAFDASIDQTMGDPVEVARKIADVLEDPSPRLRYPMGPMVAFRIAAKALVPFSVFSWGLRRALGMPGTIVDQ